MKKTVIVLLSALLVAVAFAACSSNNGNTVQDQTGDPKNTSTTSSWQATTITTDTAKIKENDAAFYIMEYSADDLSLTEKEKQECSFMVTGTGVKIEDDYYIEVTAVIKHEKGKNEEGKTLYTFDNLGYYYIRYDGNQVLKKDVTKDTNEYTELKVHKFKKTDN